MSNKRNSIEIIKLFKNNNSALLEIILLHGVKNGIFKKWESKY